MNAGSFSRAYAFVDDLRAHELVELEAAIKKEKAPAKLAALKEAAVRVRQRHLEALRRKATAEVLDARKKQERVAVAGGKAPYFLKKREVKELAATARLSVLESGAAGGGGGSKAVEKALRRRRKKLVAKERVRMEGVGAARAGSGGGGGGGGSSAPASRRRTWEG